MEYWDIVVCVFGLPYFRMAAMVVHSMIAVPTFHQKMTSARNTGKMSFVAATPEYMNILYIV